MKRLLFALIVVALLATTAPANARGVRISTTLHTAKVRTTNPFKGLKHQRLKVARKGSVLVYNP